MRYSYRLGKIRRISPATRRYKTIGAIFGVLAAALAGLGGWYYLAQSQWAIGRYYSGQLRQLEVAVTEAADPELSGSIMDKVDQYDARLKAINQPCRNMATKTKQLQGRQLTGKLQRQTDKTGKLCADLSDVTGHSAALYAALRPYLALAPSTWPVSNSPEVKGQLEQVRKVSLYTASQLQALPNNKINDPALGELVMQLQQVSKLANDSLATHAAQDKNSTQTLYQELQKNIIQDRDDFMKARLYFWNNTFGTSDLLKSIRELNNNI